MSAAYGLVTTLRTDGHLTLLDVLHAIRACPAAGARRCESGADCADRGG